MSFSYDTRRFTKLFLHVNVFMFMNVALFKLKGCKNNWLFITDDFTKDLQKVKRSMDVLCDRFYGHAKLCLMVNNFRQRIAKMPVGYIGYIRIRLFLKTGYVF